MHARKGHVSCPPTCIASVNCTISKRGNFGTEYGISLVFSFDIGAELAKMSFSQPKNRIFMLLAWSQVLNHDGYLN